MNRRRRLTTAAACAVALALPFGPMLPAHGFGGPQVGTCKHTGSSQIIGAGSFNIVNGRYVFALAGVNGHRDVEFRLYRRGVRGGEEIGYYRPVSASITRFGQNRGVRRVYGTEAPQATIKVFRRWGSDWTCTMLLARSTSLR